MPLLKTFSLFGDNRFYKPVVLKKTVDNLMIEDTFSVKPPITVPAQARELHERISKQLKELLDINTPDCLDVQFVSGLYKIYSLLELYQQKIVADYSRKVTCAKGCCWCCYHWVEDVNSFEAQIAADYIQKKMPSRIDIIKTVCEQDIAVLENLDRLVNEKMAQKRIGDENDSMLYLLSAFYRMNRPCPLLDTEGNCAIYELRPLTCRMYMNFSSPDNCHPENINENEVSTYIMDLDEDANKLVDQLHFRYNKFGDDTGLRSLLLKYLQQ